MYQNTKRVFLAIEDISLKEEMVPALNTLIGETELTHDLSLVDPTLIAHAMEFCQTLFSARLFTRSWCWHEFACSDEHLLFIPLKPDTANTEVKVLKINTDRLKSILLLCSLFMRSATDLQMAAIVPFASSISHALKAGAKMFKKEVTPLLSESFVDIFGSRAKHKKDQVQIVLNSCITGLLYRGPALDSVSACYRILFSVALAVGDASVLGSTGPCAVNDDGSQSSWLRESTQDEPSHVFHASKREPTKFHVLIRDRDSLILEVLRLGMVMDIAHPDARWLATASRYMDLDFSDISPMQPFVFEEALHSTLDNRDYEAYRFRYVNQKHFYAQFIAYLLSSKDDFVEIVRRAGPSGRKLVTERERADVLKALGWLRDSASSENPRELAQTRPDNISDDIFAAFNKFLISMMNRVLGIRGMYDINHNDSWDAYIFGTLSSQLLSASKVPLVAPRRSPSAIICVPADVAGADYSTLKRIWILEEISNTATPEIDTSVREMAETPTKQYRLLYKTMLIGSHDISTAPRQTVCIH